MHEYSLAHIGLGAWELEPRGRFKKDFLHLHCKFLHLQYIPTTTLEIYPSSGGGVRLQDADHYISSTSISRSADVLRFKYILSVVL